MYRNKLVYLIFVIIIISSIKIELLTNKKATTKEQMINPKAKLQQTGLKLDLYANQSYITSGDAINITYGVYNSNFTIISGIQITFVFDTTIFYKYSDVNLASFSLKINQTYATVKLLGAIDSDQQAIVFFNVDQKPICVSSC
jgi:hypothetical protein